MAVNFDEATNKLVTGEAEMEAKMASYNNECHRKCGAAFDEFMDGTVAEIVKGWTYDDLVAWMVLTHKVVTDQLLECVAVMWEKTHEAKSEAEQKKQINRLLVLNLLI